MTEASIEFGARDGDPEDQQRDREEGDGYGGQPDRVVTEVTDRDAGEGRRARR